MTAEADNEERADHCVQQAWDLADRVVGEEKLALQAIVAIGEAIVFELRALRSAATEE